MTDRVDIPILQNSRVLDLVVHNDLSNAPEVDIRPFFFKEDDFGGGTREADEFAKSCIVAGPNNYIGLPFKHKIGQEGGAHLLPVGDRPLVPEKSPQLAMGLLNCQSHFLLTGVHKTHIQRKLLVGCRLLLDLFHLCLHIRRGKIQIPYYLQSHSQLIKNFLILSHPSYHFSSQLHQIIHLFFISLNIILTKGIHSKLLNSE